MRSVIYSLVILLLIVGLIIYSSYYVGKTANDLAYGMEDIIKSAEEDDWNKVTEVNNQNIEKWYKASKKYSWIFHHDEIDAISIHMEELDKYIMMEEKTDVLATAGSLRFLFEHLPKRNQLNWENIL